MDNFQPLFWEDLRIAIPGYSILRFSHHRHTEKSDLVEEHTHTHSQLLLYLRGQGVQTVSQRPIQVRRGSLLYFPPGRTHGFVKSMKSPPLSLVINFKEKKGPGTSKAEKVISAERLSEVERTLNQMIASVDLTPVQNIQLSSDILKIFSILLGELEKKKERKVLPVTQKIRSLLQNLEIIPKSAGELASILDEDLSCLNRKIRQESTLNLSTLLNEIRQNRAFDELKNPTLPISQISWNCGFADPNYFARWFRKKVGQSPRQWRIGSIG
jgi:AraC-like DNA-binding protein/mannose-6-phosphate isomerase-like protein (cupin superfamily)